jgi:hypothetical protein
MAFTCIKEDPLKTSQLTEWGISSNKFNNTIQCDLLRTYLLLDSMYSLLSPCLVYSTTKGSDSKCILIQLGLMVCPVLYMTAERLHWFCTASAPYVYICSMCVLYNAYMKYLSILDSIGCFVCLYILYVRMHVHVGEPCSHESSRWPLWGL